MIRAGDGRSLMFSALWRAKLIRLGVCGSNPHAPICFHSFFPTIAADFISLDSCRIWPVLLIFGLEFRQKIVGLKFDLLQISALRPSSLFYVSSRSPEANDVGAKKLKPRALT